MYRAVCGSVTPHPLALISNWISGVAEAAGFGGRKLHDRDSRQRQSQQPKSPLSRGVARSAGVCAAVVLILIASILPSPAASNVPEGYPATRYESLWKRSPFTLSSITEEQGPTSAFSERYSLGGAYTVGKKDYVIVVNRTNPQERLTVSAEPNEQGLTLLSVSYDNDAPMKTTAVIKQGEETGPIAFDEALIKSTATAAANAAVAMPPPQVPRPPTYTPGPPGAPTRRIVRPRIIAPPPGTTSTPTRP